MLNRFLNKKTTRITSDLSPVIKRENKSCCYFDVFPVIKRVDKTFVVVVVVVVVIIIMIMMMMMMMYTGAPRRSFRLPVAHEVIADKKYFLLEMNQIVIIRGQLALRDD